MPLSASSRPTKRRSHTGGPRNQRRTSEGILGGDRHHGPDYVGSFAKGFNLLLQRRRNCQRECRFSDNAPVQPRLTKPAAANIEAIRLSQKRTQKPGRLPKRSRKKDIDKITLEDFAEEFLGGEQSAELRTHCEEPALQSLILKAKIIELTILIIGGMGSYEDRLAALMPDIAGELARMIVDVSAPCVIDGDRSVIHDKNPLAIVSRKHSYADRDNWKKTYAAEAAQNRK